MHRPPLSPDQLLQDGFIIEVGHYPDTPLQAGDYRLLTDGRSGQVLIARAPIQLRVDTVERPA